MAKYKPNPESQRKGAIRGNQAKAARKTFERLFGEKGSPTTTDKALPARPGQCRCVQDGKYLRCSVDCELHGLKRVQW